jgi:hypothetical protein
MSNNSWIQFVKEFQKQNPELSYKECLQKAKYSYNKTEGSGIFSTSKYATNALLDFIEKHKNDVINSVYFCVEPVQRYLTTLLNIFTKKQLENKLKELSINELLHAYSILVIETKEGRISARFERNAKFDIREGNDLRGNNSKCIAGVNVNRITVGELFKNFQNNIGGWENENNAYDPKERNCQFFIEILAESANVLTPQLKSFVSQPTKEIMKDFPRTSKVIEHVVKLGAIL